MSKYVYLASMGAKINHIVGGQNQEFFQYEHLLVMSVKTWAISKEKNAKIYAFVHRNLMVNSIEFGCKFCRICHLGRLPTIIIDVLYLTKTFVIILLICSIIKTHSNALANVTRRLTG